MKILCVVHVFYPEFWPELADCIRNVDEPFDLVVTYVDESKDIPGMVRRDFPDAKTVLCENRGFDVWPFFKAMSTVDAYGYDLIVKLHTKRDVKASHSLIFNHRNYLGPRWRNYLLGFIRHSADWQATKARFADPAVGMVADARVILRKDDVPWRTPRATAVQAAEFTSKLYGPSRHSSQAGRSRLVGGRFLRIRARRHRTDRPSSRTRVRGRGICRRHAYRTMPRHSGRQPFPCVPCRRGPRRGIVLLRRASRQWKVDSQDIPYFRLSGSATGNGGRKG